MAEPACTVDTATVEEAYDVFLSIPEFDAGLTPLTDFSARLGGRDACIEVARSADGTAVGFKAGYDRYGDGSFYSWLGGVQPAHRGGGVAQILLESQERWALEKGYRSIYVRTRNRFVGMRILLARNGYVVTRYDQPRDVPTAEGRLTLVKWLSPDSSR